MLVVIGGVQLFLLAVSGIAGMIVRSRGGRGTGVAWAFAVLAFAVTNMFFSGLLLWITKYLSEHARHAQRASIRPGRELTVVDAYLAVAILWALIIGVTALLRRHIVRDPTTCTGGELRDEWVNQVRTARGTARIMHTIDRLVVALALVFVVVGFGYGLQRAGAFAGKAPWSWHLKAPNQRGLAYAITAWALPALVVFVVVRVRRAASDNRIRRFTGQVWDVLSFWPRRFHPFAVKPYSHVAVPALERHIATLLEAGPVVLSAHSQGSILAIAALSQMTDVHHMSLVTYGSPAGTLHRRAFGAYFDQDDLMALRTRMRAASEGVWKNLYRETDPVGGPMFDGDADICVNDPATTPPQPDPVLVPLEGDREPWTDLAIHSYYLRERALKQVVLEMKARLRDRAEPSP